MHHRQPAVQVAARASAEVLRHSRFVMGRDAGDQADTEETGEMPRGESATATSARLSVPAPGEHDLIETTPDAEAAMPSAIEASSESARGLGAAFRALRHRNFRLFFGGQLTSLIGTWMQTVAQSWLVLKLTNSALMLGLV